MSSDGVTGLRFRSRELCDEAAALREMAASFFVCGWPLKDLERQMERLGGRSSERGAMLKLEPLRTIETDGYESGGRAGGAKLYAHVTGKWELRPVGPERRKQMVAFTGLASARVELWPDGCQWHEKDERPKRIAMWRMELGAYDSPGCYFHCQVLGDGVDSPFPKSVPIPRLPSPFVTPMAAVEFVLGELFQDRWAQEACRARSGHQRWRAIQEKRWSRLLQWQQGALGEHGGSPWMKIKAAKPPDTLFVPS